MKVKNKIIGNMKPKWNVSVEYTGTTAQREQALRQATRFILFRLSERRKKLPGEEKLTERQKQVYK